jgi:isocitrate/isopropylmalate dehydrogenase
MSHICRVAYGLRAALSGSLGIAPTANLNPERRFSSMFEPIHGCGRFSV